MPLQVLGRLDAETLREVETDRRMGEVSSVQGWLRVLFGLLEETGMVVLKLLVS